jgi:transposase
MSKQSSLRLRRTFSNDLKIQIVRDLEKGKSTVASVKREYEVSGASVYNWLNKYSRHLHSNHPIVMQKDSEAYKTKELEKRIKELEAALGRKQMEIDFLNQMIEQGKEELGVDLKKKFSTPPSTGTDKTEKDTATS